jgi:hypothetical protein
VRYETKKKIGAAALLFVAVALSFGAAVAIAFNRAPLTQ